MRHMIRLSRGVVCETSKQTRLLRNEVDMQRLVHLEYNPNNNIHKAVI